jgi:hypothetical protein
MMKRTKHIYLVMMATATAVATVLSACSDKLSDESGETGTGVRFSISTVQADEITAGGTRASNASAPGYKPTVLRTHGGPKLYLHQNTVGAINKHDAAATARTRGSIITTDNFWDQIAVQGKGYDANNNAIDLFDGDAVTVSKSDSWYTNRVWPSKFSNVRFFAYAPVDFGGTVAQNNNAYWSPTITYTVPQDVSKQQDVMYAQTDLISGSSLETIPLTFHHILTGIRFAVGEINNSAVINSITISGVYNSGWYSYMDSSTKTVWASSTVSSSATNSYTITPNFVVSSNKNTYISNDVMFLLPQTCPKDAKITMNITLRGQPYNLSASLAGQQWPVGTTVTYKLSTSAINNNYVITVDPEVTYTDYAGGDVKFNVMSYSYKPGTTGSSVKERNSQNWTTYFSTDNGSTWTTNSPSWLTIPAKSQDSNLKSGVAYSGTATAQTALSTGMTHTQRLQAATYKGSSSAPYDLSTHDLAGNTIAQTTANCYVVNAPGTYMIPLVYGNGIVDGKTNTTALNAASAVTSAGYRITDPYICVNMDSTNSRRLFTRSGAVIWQDASNLVTNLKLVQDASTLTVHPESRNRYLVFTIDENNIQQGNAVIAVYRNTNECLWTWHIWVTDEDVSATRAVTNADGKTTQLMPFNLGWVSKNTNVLSTYETRSVLVKLKQDASDGQEAIFTIKQLGGDSDPDNQGYNTFYEWGRLTPFPDGEKNVSGITKSSISGLSGTANAIAKAAIATAIHNPTVLYTKSSSADWIPDQGIHYLDLWNVGNTATSTATSGSVVKSIYDPCPAGFHVPEGTAFTGFYDETTSTSDRSDGSRFNVVGGSNSFSYGYKFYCKPMISGSYNITGSYIFMPAKDESETNQGSYWTALPGSDNSSAYSLFFYYRNSGDNKQIKTQKPQYRRSALSIRPQKE